MNGTTDAALLRQILEGQAAMSARVEAVVEKADAAAADAREARDLGRQLSTKLEEQNIIGRLSEHRTEMRQIVAEIRQDFVAANTLLKKEIVAECEARQALEKRVEVLEAERNKVVGVATFFSWLARVAPWLAAILMAAIAGAGLDKKLGG